jgi:hypothetical protein
MEEKKMMMVDEKENQKKKRRRRRKRREEIFFDIKENRPTPQCLVWFSGLDSSQNGQNGLIHNWCIGGWWVTAALYTGSITAKKSWTPYQDQTSKKFQKSRQY